MELAMQHQVRSIAFPAISTGVYGFPLQSAAKIAVTTVKNYIGGSGIDVVKFVCFDDRTLSTYEQLLADSGMANEP
jgi:O-acetyl-ADP-ribose deacetylase (regulator of RNase III)